MKGDLVEIAVVFEDERETTALTEEAMVNKMNDDDGELQGMLARMKSYIGKSDVI